MGAAAKYLIVEDEKRGADLLGTFLKSYFPNSECLGMAASVNEAVELIAAKKPNLVFLDIEIKGGTGFDVLDKCSREFHVVFTTGYDQYAIRAIKYGAFDYLLKPIQIEDIKDLVARFEAGEIFLSSKDYINPIRENFDKIAVFHNGSRQVIDLGDIICMEADGKYTRIVGGKDLRLVSSYNLGYYEDLLGDKDFLRIHHNVMVNNKHVKKMDLKNLFALMSNNEQYTISQRRVKWIRESLEGRE